MNKILTVVMVALSSAAAFGELSWASISTVEYDKDSSPSSGTLAYTAYLCTAAAAADEFGSSEIGRVTTYFANNFVEASGKLSDLTSSDPSARLENGATTFGTIMYSDDLGQYTFLTRFTDGVTDLVADSEYLGIILYSSGDDQAVRVFKTAASGSGPIWTVNDLTSAATKVGEWTAAVPEPTSGLLLLLGLAGLALKRKRA